MTTPLYFWPGADALATHLAAWLDSKAALPLDDLAPKTGLVLWHGPEHALTRCLTIGDDVQTALTDWKHAARSLLAHARQNRRTLMLADADRVLRDGAAGLAQRLGRDAPADLPASPAVPLAQALAQALSRLALQDDTDLQVLIDDLTSASLPGPDALGNVGLIEQIAAAVAHQTGAHSAELAHAADLALAQRDQAAAQMAALHDAMTAQQQAEQIRSAAAAQSQAALQDLLRAREQDLATLRTTLNSQTDDLDLLRRQIGLGDTALTQQFALGDTRDGVAALRINAAESQLAIMAADATVHLTQIAQLTQALTDAGYQTATAKAEIARLTALQSDLHADLALLQTQIALAQDGAAASLATAYTAADLTVLQTQTRADVAVAQLVAANQTLAARDDETALLRNQLALAQDSAVANAQTAAQQAKSHKTELALLRTQLDLAVQASTSSMASAQNRGDAATLRAQTRLAELDQTMAAAQSENALLRGQLAVSNDVTATSLTRADSRNAANLATLLADHAAEVALLTTQISLLDGDLSRLMMAPPPPATSDTAANGGDPAYRDKALARALASARDEADRRARLEQDLDALRATAKSQTRRAEDQAHNRHLFAQMTKEATASLDEIARLSAALATVDAPQAL